MERIVDRLGGRREAQPSNHLEATRHKEAKSKLINSSLSNLCFKTLLQRVTKFSYFSQSPNFCFDYLINVLKEVMQAVTVKIPQNAFMSKYVNMASGPKGWSGLNRWTR